MNYEMSGDRLKLITIKIVNIKSYELFTPLIIFIIIIFVNINKSNYIFHNKVIFDILIKNDPVKNC
jgi:hypothetical protein